MRTVKLFVLGLMLMVTNSVAAQTVKEVADSVKSGVKSGNVKTMVNTVKDAFKAKAATAETLVGTWKYVEPAVLVTSGNLLMKAAGNATAGRLEKLLTEYIEKTEISPENTFITFHEDGTFERSVADRKAKGVWMVNGEKLLLAIQNVQTASLTTHLEDGQLTLVIQAARVLQMMQTLGALSDSKATKALVKVSKKLSGIEGGFLFEKK